MVATKRSRDGGEGLQLKVAEWLRKQGYPLQFTTAEAFAKAGLEPIQGVYVPDAETGKMREVDVLARSQSHGRALLQIDHVVECRWSEKHPWVMFTDSRRRVDPETCIAGTIASELGAAALYLGFPMPDLETIPLFSCRERPAFGGVRALADKNRTDDCYSAIQGVVAKSSAVATQDDRSDRPKARLPDIARLVFPVIVVKGQLFEAYTEPGSSDLQVQEIQRVRLYWSGSPAWKMQASVDIVTLDSLDGFLAERVLDLPKLAEAMAYGVSEVVRCFDDAEHGPLRVSPEVDQRTVPSLLRDLREVARERWARGPSRTG